MRTTFFIAALIGSVNSLNLAGDSAAGVVSATTADLASQIDAAASLDAGTDRKMKANNESSDGGYSKSECAAAFKKKAQCEKGEKCKEL